MLEYSPKCKGLTFFLVRTTLWLCRGHKLVRKNYRKRTTFEIHLSKRERWVMTIAIWVFLSLLIPTEKKLLRTYCLLTPKNWVCVSWSSIAAILFTTSEKKATPWNIMSSFTIANHYYHKKWVSEFNSECVCFPLQSRMGYGCFISSSLIPGKRSTGRFENMSYSSWRDHE